MAKPHPHPMFSTMTPAVSGPLALGALRRRAVWKKRKSAKRFKLHQHSPQTVFKHQIASAFTLFTSKKRISWKIVKAHATCNTRCRETGDFGVFVFFTLSAVSRVSQLGNSDCGSELRAERVKKKTSGLGAAQRYTAVKGDQTKNYRIHCFKNVSC